ncbi:hypothetical protein BH11PAT1_BH11PAT1_7710 [soil metagenome]
MIHIEFTGNFNRLYRNLIDENLGLKDIIRDCIRLFKRNPDDSRLENHPLRKRMRGKHAISITDDIRIIYEWTGKSTVRFLAIGTHEDVYIN